MRKLTRPDIIALRNALVYAIIAHERTCPACPLIISPLSSSNELCKLALHYVALDKVLRDELRTLVLDGAA